MKYNKRKWLYRPTAKAMAKEIGCGGNDVHYVLNGNRHYECGVNHKCGVHHESTVGMGSTMGMGSTVGMGYTVGMESTMGMGSTMAT